jgi:hypothetical protein
MNSKQKQQSSVDEELREDPTIDSALPNGCQPARTSPAWSSKFSVGDMVVEAEGYGTPRFGIILSIHNDKTFSVRYADGIDYAFASHCRLYSEWLRDQKS